MPWRTTRGGGGGPCSLLNVGWNVEANLSAWTFERIFGSSTRYSLRTVPSDCGTSRDSIPDIFNISSMPWTDMTLPYSSVTSYWIWEVSMCFGSCFCEGFWNWAKAVDCEKTCSEFCLIDGVKFEETLDRFWPINEFNGWLLERLRVRCEVKGDAGSNDVFVWVECRSSGCEPNSTVDFDERRFVEVNLMLELEDEDVGDDVWLVDDPRSNLALILANFSLDDGWSSSDVVPDDVKSRAPWEFRVERGFSKTYSSRKRKMKREQSSSSFCQSNVDL